MKSAGALIVFVMGCSTGGGGGFKFDLSTAGGDLSGGSADLSQMGTPDLSMSVEPDLTMPSSCSAAGDYAALGKKTGMGASLMDMNGNEVVTWQTDLDAAMLPDVISLELYGGSGAFKGLTAPKVGVYQIAGDELNYETCGVCIRLLTDTDAGNPLDVYFATAGTVTLNSVAGRITGSITNAKFEHVQIDPNTFHSTPDPSGCKSALTSISFDDVIVKQ